MEKNAFIFVVLAFYSISTYANNDFELPIYVFEIKPLIYIDEESKNIKGTWYDSFEMLSSQSKLKFKYQFTSIPRLEKFLESKAPGCSLTLLRTKKRENIKGIQFVHDHPVKTLIKSYQRSEDNRKLTIDDMREKTHLKIASNTSVGIDILKRLNINSELFLNINSITNMLLHKRLDIFVGSNLAIEKLTAFREKKIKPGVVIKSLTHSIACSGGTHPEVLAKLKHGAKSWHLAD